MSSTTDRILDLIDAGLQSSEEHGYEPGAQAEIESEWCARCRRHRRAEGIEMCEGCRAFLLGDSTEDPAAVNDDFELVNGRGEIVGAFTPVRVQRQSDVFPVVQHGQQLLPAAVPEDHMTACRALGVDENNARRLWREELAAAEPDDGLGVVRDRTLARSSLLAAGREPGPPGRQGDEWRRRCDPNLYRRVIDRLERREDGQIWASGEIDTFTAADPAPTTRWQAVAHRHLGDCFDELASLAGPVRQGEPIIVVADDIGEAMRLLSGDPTRGPIFGLPERMRNGLLVMSPNDALARYSERGTIAPAAWFLTDGQVRVAECWVCGGPVSWVEIDDGYWWDRPLGSIALIPRPAPMTLAPCGHSTSHVASSDDPAACLYQITIYDSTHLAKVASWLAAWAYWIAGEVPERGPRLATAERITSTL